MITRRSLVASFLVAAAACSSTTTGGAGGTASGGASSQGGSSGGTTSSGGRSETGGSSASGGSNAAGGSGSGGKAATGGVIASGGSTATGGTTVAQSGGGSGSGGVTASGGNASGGSTGPGGSASGGSTGAGGSTTGGSTGSAPVPSKGCGKSDGVKTITAGGTSVSGAPTTSTRLHVMSGGKSRDVIIDIPADYDPSQPYRLVFSWRQMGGSDTGNATGLHPAGDGPNFDAEHYAYFGLRRESLNAKQPAIFVAPDTDPIGGLWDYAKDSVYFDDLLALVTTDLCIDESRVFTTGFSFGAMFSYTLSVGRATKLRAAVTMAPTNTVLAQPTNNHVAVAYMSTTGMSDGTCGWNAGGKACVIQHATDNGCTVPSTFPTAAVGSKKYVCYDFEGCKAGFPVKVCTFDGPHTPSSVDDGTVVGEDGLKAFIPPIAWKFISQF